MSYSRWSHSVWYTYWACPPAIENRDTALFDVCGVQLFKAKELRNDLEWCIGLVREKTKEGYEPPVTEKDIDELRGYVQEFLDDVDSVYPYKKMPVEFWLIMYGLAVGLLMFLMAYW